MCKRTTQLFSLVMAVGFSLMAAGCSGDEGASLPVGSTAGSTPGSSGGQSGGGNGGSHAGGPLGTGGTTGEVGTAMDSGGSSDLDAASNASFLDAAGDGAAASGSCVGTKHPLCIDFESGNVDPPWTAPATNAAVEKGQSAHGQYAMHLSGLHSKPKLSQACSGACVYLHTAQLNGIKDVMWGRYYLYMDPGAPFGHGALVKTYDQALRFYEVGFESNAYLGNWHVPDGQPGGEKYMRSKFVVPGKRWVCVEFQFDGALPAVAKIWSDGTEVMFDVIAPTPNPIKVVQFDSVNIGIEFWHGTSLTSYNGDEAPFLTDLWMDDIALDTTRVGCLP